MSIRGVYFKLTVIISGEIDAGRLSSASSAEEKLGGHKFKDDPR